jgi:hypothetical protein
MISPTVTKNRWYTQTAFTGYVGVALVLAYGIVIVKSSAIGLGDFPNHLARAYIMADLIFGHGASFGTQFQFHFQAVPYALHDLLLAASIELFGPAIAMHLWTALAFLSIPAAMLLYFRVFSERKGAALLADEGTLFLLLCALYLSTDFFFVVGFFAFNLGFACVIVALTFIELLRRRWSNGLFALYVGIVVTGYLIHLSTLVLLGTIVGVSALVRLWFRSTSLRHEVLLFAPIVALFAWQFGVADHYRLASDLGGEVFRWGPLEGKVHRTTFNRYGGRLDPILRYVYGLSLLLLIRSRAWRDAFTSPRVVESLAVAAAFFALFFILPFSYSGGSYIDMRMLPPAAFFLLLACLQLPRVGPSAESSRRVPSLALGLAFVLSVANLGYLGKNFVKLSTWSTQYRALFDAIPRGAHVLPICTNHDIFKYMEPSPITVIDRHVSSFPAIFSGSTGQSMTNFRYIDRPYRPAGDWFVGVPPNVDWRRIACTYQYILVTQPYDASLFPLAMSPVAQNSSGALLAVDPHACGETLR